MAESLPTITLTSKGAARAVTRHHWIYRSDLKQAPDLAGGEIVKVVAPNGHSIGRALYSSTSQIALRFIAFNDQPIDREFWRRRLQSAVAYRNRVVSDTDAYRLVHGEADFLSSLVIDRYGDNFVIQTLSQGMDRLKPLWTELLIEEFAPKSIIERNDSKVRLLESLPQQKGILYGAPPEQLVMVENGLKFGVDLLEGQKTGAFLDQRENRRAARELAAGRALDCFSFHGSFALHLAQKADSVIAVDISEPALNQAKANAALNNLRNIEFRGGNVFDLLKAFDEGGEKFDTIVLDPPAFAKNRQALEAGLRGYKEINLRALRLLNPGGVLITCTCSYHASENLFLGLLAEAAADVKRELQLVEKRIQARDHPILLAVPETYYLKCFILRVL